MSELQLRDQRLELLVVDEQVDPLAVADLPHLRAREARVQENHSGAAFGCGEQRLEKPGVVAGHDRDTLTGLQTAVEPGGGKRVHAIVQFAIGQLHRARR